MFSLETTRLFDPKEYSIVLTGEQCRNYNILNLLEFVENVKSTFGPNGCTKLLLDPQDGTMFVTDDLWKILKFVEAGKPIHNVLLKLLQYHQEHYYDGKTSILLILSELLKLSMEISSKDKKILAKILENVPYLASLFLDEIAFKVPVDQKIIERIMINILTTKSSLYRYKEVLSRSLADFFMNHFVTEYFQNEKQPEQQTLHLNTVNYLLVPQAPIEDSFYFSGCAMEFDALFSFDLFHHNDNHHHHHHHQHQQQQQQQHEQQIILENVKMVILGFNLSASVSNDGNITIQSPQIITQMEISLEVHIKKIISSLNSKQINVVIVPPSWENQFEIIRKYCQIPKTQSKNDVLLHDEIFKSESNNNNNNNNGIILLRALDRDQLRTLSYQLNLPVIYSIEKDDNFEISPSKVKTLTKFYLTTTNQKRFRCRAYLHDKNCPYLAVVLKAPSVDLLKEIHNFFDRALHLLINSLEIEPFSRNNQKLHQTDETDEILTKRNMMMMIRLLPGCYGGIETYLSEKFLNYAISYCKEMDSSEFSLYKRISEAFLVIPRTLLQNTRKPYYLEIPKLLKRNKDNFQKKFFGVAQNGDIIETDNTSDGCELLALKKQSICHIVHGYFRILDLSLLIIER